MTTYLTTDSSGAHGNNGYKTVKEDLSWSENGYKKPFAAERTLNSLFGSIDAEEHITTPDPANTFQHYTVTAFQLGRK